jgi:hypothetical protein
MDFSNPFTIFFSLKSKALYPKTQVDVLEDEGRESSEVRQ